MGDALFYTNGPGRKRARGSEMKPSAETAALDGALSAIGKGEAAEAAHALERLERALRTTPRPEARHLKQVWEPFLELLRRRGYFISSPQEIEGTLDEIFATGLGFDLYEVAAAIARCDLALAECLRAIPDRIFPSLTLFAPECRCENHPPSAREAD